MLSMIIQRRLHELQRYTLRGAVPVGEGRWDAARETESTHLCKMELQRVVRTQANVQANTEELWERITFIREEERIVAKWAHSDANLLEVKEVLKCWNLTEEDAVRDGMRGEECRRKVIWIAGFSAMRSEDKRICSR